MQLDSWQKRVLDEQGNVHIRAGRQVGKSTIVSEKAAAYAVNNDKKLVMVIAFTERQAYLLFEKILGVLTRDHLKMVKKGKDKPTKHEIKLVNGTKILCLPTGVAGFGIMGYTIDLLICDEAAFVPDEVFRSVIPSLAVTKGKIWLLSTPCGSSGYFYDTSKDDNFAHFHITSEECDRVDRDFLEREKRRLSAGQYAQWYLGEFISSFNRMFSDELIRQACILKRRTTILADRKYYLGCDLARLGGDQITFEVIDKIDRETMEHVESIVMTKKFTTETEDNIVELHKRWNFKRIGIDAGAGTLGVSILDHLLREDSTKSKVVALNNRQLCLDNSETQRQRILKEDMYYNLLKLLEKRQLKLLDDDEIMLSLASVQYEYETEEGKKTSFRIFGQSTHVVEGIIRACWLACEDKSLNLWAR